MPFTMVSSGARINRRNMAQADHSAMGGMAARRGGGGGDDPASTSGSIPRGARPRTLADVGGSEAEHAPNASSSSRAHRSRSDLWQENHTNNDVGATRNLYTGSDFIDADAAVGPNSFSHAMNDPDSDLRQFLDEDAKPLHSPKAWFYNMAIEPMRYRRESIILISEAHTIFGALFLNGLWFAWEYGRGSTGIYTVDRIFDVCAALSIIANVMMVMFASFLWLISTCQNGNENWVFEARHFLQFLHYLVVAIFLTVTPIIGIGIYGNLQKNLVDAILVLGVLIGVALTGLYHTSYLCAHELPEVLYHMPNWFKVIMFPFPFLSRKSRQEIREGAARRAKYHRGRAMREQRLCNTNAGGDSTLKPLLRRAAAACGRKDFDIVPYAVNLENDWYDTAASLKGLDVTTLSRFMPRRLAEEVHRIQGGDDFGLSMPARSKLSETQMHELHEVEE